mgnify:CR=1 FL=1
MVIAKLFFIFIGLNITTFAADVLQDDRYHPTSQPIMYVAAKNIRATGKDTEVTLNTVKGSRTVVTMHTDIAGDIVAAEGSKIVVGSQYNTNDAYQALDERPRGRVDHDREEENPLAHRNRARPQQNPFCCAIL